MDPSIFREYDIRGLVGDTLTEEIVEKVGRAFGTVLRRDGRRSVCVGRDVRQSSEDFVRALTRGLVATGCEVLDAGMLPTPCLYYGILVEEAGGGVMVTGSHNPIEYNGLKLCLGALAIHGDAVQELRRLIEAGDFETGEGSAREIDVMTRYVAEISAAFPPGAARRIAVDCGNGVAGPLIPGLLRAAGHEVEELYCEPDGSFPNHLPDPEVPEYMVDLVARVKEKGADLGLGFDGDGDRIGVIDEKGRKVSADHLLIVFARDLLTRHPGGVVRYDVKCSDVVAPEVEKAGGRPVMGRTGHSILKAEMKELDAILGGELSGHLVFGREWHPIDDPFFCALRLLQIMDREGASCSSLFEDIPHRVATAEIKAAVPEDRKFAIVAELVEEFRRDFEVLDTDGARVAMAEGWGLVRASNTTANLTLRFEAADEAGLEAVRRAFIARLEKHPEIDLERVRAAF